MAEPKVRDLLAEPSAPSAAPKATPPEGVRDLLSEAEKPAIFFPSAEKEKKRLEAKPEPLTIEPKEFSTTEAIEAGGTGAAISAAAPESIENCWWRIRESSRPCWSCW
jgi:hypothetical protein